METARPESSPVAIDLDEPLSLGAFREFVFNTYRIEVSKDSVRRYRVDGLEGRKLESFRFGGRHYITPRSAFDFFGPPPPTVVSPTEPNHQPALESPKVFS